MMRIPSTLRRTSGLLALGIVAAAGGCQTPAASRDLNVSVASEGRTPAAQRNPDVATADDGETPTVERERDRDSSVTVTRTRVVRRESAAEPALRRATTHTALPTRDAADVVYRRLERLGFSPVHWGKSDHFGAAVYSAGSDDRTFNATLRWQSEGDVVATFESNLEPRQFDHVVADLKGALSVAGPTTAPSGTPAGPPPGSE